MTPMAEKQKREDPERGERLRGLAAVDEVLREPAARELLERYPRALVVDAVRAVVARLRAEILAAGAAGEASAAQAADLTAAALVPWVTRLVEAAVTPSLRRVINATGVVVHTNLGRAPLPREAVDAVVTAASGYTDLEYNLARGERASRQDHVHDVLCTVTGAEDALVVNNNAAAVLLAVAADPVIGFAARVQAFFDFPLVDAFALMRKAVVFYRSALSVGDVNVQKCVRRQSPGKHRGRHAGGKPGCRPEIAIFAAGKRYGNGRYAPNGGFKSRCHSAGVRDIICHIGAIVDAGHHQPRFFR